jgi:hypothetical protein
MWNLRTFERLHADRDTKNCGKHDHPYLIALPRVEIMIGKKTTIHSNKLLRKHESTRRPGNGPDLGFGMRTGDCTVARINT